MVTIAAVTRSVEMQRRKKKEFEKKKAEKNERIRVRESNIFGDCFYDFETESFMYLHIFHLYLKEHNKIHFSYDLVRKRFTTS